MKIGIVTWFSYENYGTVLQAYALQRFLINKGYNCELLNYLPKTTFEKIAKIESLRSIIISKKNNLIYKYISVAKKKQLENKTSSFKKFTINNCIFTEALMDEVSLVELNKIINTYICGSDQIWSPKALDGTYYLNFVDEKNKKISYAPSFGMTEVPDQYKKIVGNWISKIDFLSVRERQGEEIIRDLTGMKASVVLDPTLLLKPEDWEKVLTSPNIQTPYILCYFVGDKKHYWKNVEKIRKATGYKVVIIPITPTTYLRKGTVLSETGPAEFVGLIKNAEVVLTDSFHGTIFSINYKKDFYVFKRFADKDKGSENSRIYDILEKLNLENRLIDNNESVIIENIKMLNYEDVESRLDKQRNNSIEFLNNALES